MMSVRNTHVYSLHAKTQKSKDSVWDPAFSVLDAEEKSRIPD